MHANVHRSVFTIAKIQKKPKCCWQMNGLRCGIYTHTMEYYSVMEMNEILPFATMCMDLGCCSQNSRVGIESGQCTVWEKETRDRSKVLQMGPGDSRPLGQEPCCLEPHHFYLVSWQAESICCVTMTSASCVPGHVSCFIDYFKPSLLFSCTRAIT